MGSWASVCASFMEHQSSIPPQEGRYAIVLDFLNCIQGEEQRIDVLQQETEYWTLRKYVPAVSLNSCVKIFFW